MDYVEKNLGKGEEIILRAKVNWLALLVNLFWGLIVEIALIVIKNKLGGVTGGSGSEGTDPMLFVQIFIHVLAWLPAVKKFLIIVTTKLAVTNKRVIGKVGIFSVQAIDFHIDKVDNVTYDAGVFGNLFKYYKVTVSGTGGDKKTVFPISNAFEFKNRVNEAVEQHAEEARKAQAAEIAMAMGRGV